MSVPAKAQAMGNAAYHAWRNEVVIDLSDYTFTRNELNNLGLGLHCVGAGRLHRIARRNNYTLRDLRDMNMDSIWRIDGVGQTLLIVIAYLLCATYPAFDLDRWIGNPARSIAGGVRANARKKKG